MPDTLRRVIRYSDYAALPCTSGVLGTWVFAANGVYDPDITGTGHQPMGFDQYMTFYDHCTVVSARITVDAVATSVPVFFGVAVSRDGSAFYSSYNSYIESGTVVYRLIDTEGSALNRVSRTLDIAKWFGFTDLNDTTQFCTTSANPAQGVYFHVLAQDVNKTSTANAEINVVIDYDVVFSQPKPVATS